MKALIFEKIDKIRISFKFFYFSIANLTETLIISTTGWGLWRSLNLTVPLDFGNSLLNFLHYFKGHVHVFLFPL